VSGRRGAAARRPRAPAGSIDKLRSVPDAFSIMNGGRQPRRRGTAFPVPTRWLVTALAAGAAAAAVAACARPLPAATDTGNRPGDSGGPNGTDAVSSGGDGTPSGSDAVSGGTDALPFGTDAAPPGTDAWSGPVWTPPAGDGDACAPEPCPVTAPQCVGPSDTWAYCRATCNETVTPDPCYPDYDCVALGAGGGACLPAAARGGCCAQCGCGPGDICVSISGAEPVCLEECDPASPTNCGAFEGCVMITGPGVTLGGACLPSPAPTCSGDPAMESTCI
jgi:hypothetical protein